MRPSKLILCLVFLPCLAFADPNYYLGASGVPAAAGDACGTDNLAFSSHFEGTGNSSTTFDVTTGTPAGCNTNADKTITYYSDAVNSTDNATDGTYSFKRAGNGDYAVINTLDPIAVDSALSIELDIKIMTFTTGRILYTLGDTDNMNKIQVKAYGTDELQFFHYITNGTTVNASVTTSGWDLATDTWYRIRIRTRIGTTDPSMEVTKDGASDAVDNADTVDRGANIVRSVLGSTVTATEVWYIDNAQYHNTWKTGDEWGD